MAKSQKLVFCHWGGGVERKDKSVLLKTELWCFSNFTFFINTHEDDQQSLSKVPTINPSHPSNAPLRDNVVSRSTCCPTHPSLPFPTLDEGTPSSSTQVGFEKRGSYARWRRDLWELVASGRTTIAKEEQTCDSDPHLNTGSEYIWTHWYTMSATYPSRCRYSWRRLLRNWDQHLVDSSRTHQLVIPVSLALYWTTKKREEDIYRGQTW